MNQLDPSIGGLLKNLGYATGQFGKNHLGDRNESLPTVNGFDEFFGNLYHLNAEEEPELPDYPKDPEYLKKFGPRGVLKCTASVKMMQLSIRVLEKLESKKFKIPVRSQKRGWKRWTMKLLQLPLIL